SRAPSSAVTRNIFLRVSNADLIPSNSESATTGSDGVGAVGCWSAKDDSVAVIEGCPTKAGCVAALATEALIAFVPDLVGLGVPPPAGLEVPPAGGTTFI